MSRTRRGHIRGGALRYSGVHAPSDVREEGFGVDRSELDALIHERTLAREAWDQALTELIETEATNRPVALASYRSARAHFYDVHESLEAHLISLLRTEH